MKRIDLAISPAFFDLRASLRENGGDLRVAGGAIRDAARGDPVRDVDMVFDDGANGVRMAALFEQHGIQATSPFHGDFLWRIDDVAPRVELFRLGAFRRGPPGVDPWVHDMTQRDFTMNAMWATLEGEVHDPHGGWADALAGHVRWNGAMEDRVREDEQRILRWVRFSARYGSFEAESPVATFALAWRASRGRIMDELERMLRDPSAETALAMLERHGILKALSLPDPRPLPVNHPVGLEPEHDPFEIAFGVDRYDVEMLLMEAEHAFHLARFEELRAERAP